MGRAGQLLQRPAQDTAHLYKQYSDNINNEEVAKVNHLLVVWLGLELQLAHVLKIFPEHLGIFGRLEALERQKMSVETMY